MQNIFWTISKNYEKKYQGRENFYAIAEDAMQEYLFPKNQLENFIKRNTQFLSNNEDLEQVVRIMAREWIRQPLFYLRPGVKEFENKFYQEIFHIEDKKRKRDLKEELNYQYARYRIDKPLTCGPVLYPLFKNILTVKECKDSKEFFQKAINLWDEFFHVNAEFVNEDIVVEIDQISKNDSIQKKKKRKIIEKKIYKEDFELEEIESAEFTNVVREQTQGEIEQEELDYISTKSQEKTLLRINMHFGQQEIQLGKLQSLERDLAIGIHQGMKIHVTKGKFAKDMNSKFFEEQILLQRQENIDMFQKNEHHYRRVIFELREILRKNLFDDFEASLWKSKSGEVDPSQIWKYTVMGKEDIFKKKNFDHQGSFSVDILLDMSASQQDRQEEVAIQGYLITEALTELGIPTRVLGFCNLFNYQIIRVFRDYKDDEVQNNEIFSYKASGSNRDGFALRYVFATMDQIQAENQVLIVLSDGKPNDHLHLSSSSKNSKVENYEDQVAVYDTAAEILQGRIKNKAILGVFTGNEEDLEQEKLIFGHDFVRITDLSRFSSIVGRYLKSVIERI